MSFDDIRKELGERIPGVCIEENLSLIHIYNYSRVFQRHGLFGSAYGRLDFAMGRSSS